MFLSRTASVGSRYTPYRCVLQLMLEDMASRIIRPLQECEEKRSQDLRTRPPNPELWREQYLNPPRLGGWRASKSWRRKRSRFFPLKLAYLELSGSSGVLGKGSAVVSIVFTVSAGSETSCCSTFTSDSFSLAMFVTFSVVSLTCSVIF